MPTADFMAGGRMQAAFLQMSDDALVSVPQYDITSTPDEVRATGPGQFGRRLDASYEGVGTVV